ncbi:MAG: hypothetical protein HQM16_14575 [Deltaproteobacteria bacterium]|nr:hypothetical protein [Deltaproteobacteria bacterium]
MSLTVDYYNKFYLGVGPNIAKSIPAGSISFMYGAINQLENPGPEKIEEFRKGHSINGLAALWPALGMTVQPDTGTSAIELGVGTPQIGIGYQYSWMIFDFSSPSTGN